MIDSNKASSFKSDFHKIIEPASKIAITSHMGPDDDSISSVLSVYFILTEKYPEKQVRIIYSAEERNDRWSYFENFDKIEFVQEVADELTDIDVLIGLDASVYSRFSKSEDKLKSFSGKKISIDHHANASDEFDLLLVDSNSSSNSELLYWIFFANRASIPPRIAEVILLGILGDTGNLRYINSNQVSAFEVVSRLVAEGNIDIAYLESHYSSMPYETFVVMKELMKNAEIHEVEGWPKFFSSYVGSGYIEKYNPTDLAISSARNIFIASYGTRITGVSWGIVATSQNGGNVKVSLRSQKNSVNVRLLVEEMGIGGGHDRASGGQYKSENGVAEDGKLCIEKIMTWMNEHPVTT